MPWLPEQEDEIKETEAWRDKMAKEFKTVAEDSDFCQTYLAKGRLFVSIVFLYRLYVQNNFIEKKRLNRLLFCSHNNQIFYLAIS